MSEQDKAKRAVKAVLADLEDRSGFDWWWMEVDAATRREIRESLAECIAKVYADKAPVEAVRRIDAIDGRGDPEGAHGEADDVLLSCVPDEVREAYKRLKERADWWATA